MAKFLWQIVADPKFQCMNVQYVLVVRVIKRRLLLFPKSPKQTKRSITITTRPIWHSLCVYLGMHTTAIRAVNENDKNKSEKNIARKYQSMPIVGVQEC